MIKSVSAFTLVATLLLPAPASAAEIGCVDTAWALFGNHKVCVVAFDDPMVPGATCHISQAQTGGLLGGFGLASSPSEFSVACRQTGPIDVDIAKLPAKTNVFTEKTSLFFKKTHVVRLVDVQHRTLVYLAISDKLIDGSPKNSISTIPIQAWTK